MANVLVTGGAGFLGSHIADALQQAGHQVTILDLKASAWRNEGQQEIIGDVTDPDVLQRALANQDYVFHLAALADLNAGKSRPIDTVAVNILGTVRLLEAAVAAGIKRIFFGSTVYVYSKQGSFYRCSKQACENYIEEFHEHFGLSYTILRYGSLYGPRADETNGVYRLLKTFMTNEEMHYGGGIHDKREYIHVEDAARMSVQVLDDSYANRHLVLTGHDKWSIRDLFSMFSEMLDKQVTVHYDRDEDPNRKGHYAITPYNYTPKAGRKLVAQEYVDMGQGLLQLIDQIHSEIHGQADH